MMVERAMGTRAVIGLDLGTSGLKGVLMGEDGRILARARASYPLLTPRLGWTEQNPEDWWQAAKAVIAELIGDGGHHLVGIGLSGQMHGAVFLDGDNSVLRPALLWNDARSGPEAQEIEALLGADRLLEITGNRASASFQATKLLWLRAHEPAVAARVARLLLPKDFLRFRLTGAFATDPSDASGTLFLDIASRRWSGLVLEAIKIEPAMLPDLFESHEITATVSAAAAAVTGLPAGVPVVAGAGDNACAALGVGLVGEGGGCSIGTSGTIFVRSAHPLIDPEGVLNSFCDATGAWHSMGVVLSAGGALSWFAREVLELDEGRTGALIDEALAAPPGAQGLLFAPHLAGERAPYRDAGASGSWIGLSLAHKRSDLARAVLEGVGFALAACLGRMRELGARPESLAVTGGGAASDGWRQLLADQFDCQLTVSAADEGPAKGAAMLAGVGCGLFGGIEEAVRACCGAAAQVSEPDPQRLALYAALLRRWSRIHPTLAATDLI